MSTFLQLDIECVYREIGLHGFPALEYNLGRQLNQSQECSHWSRRGAIEKAYNLGSLWPPENNDIRHRMT